MAASNSAFEELWRKHFPSTPPISWIVRNKHLDRWVRFHALPESKRYAEDDSETAEILRRGNILGDELFRNGDDCWLVSACRLIGECEQPWPGLVHAFNAHDHAEDETWAIYAMPVQWRSGMFDDLLRKIANYETNAVLWLGGHVGCGVRSIRRRIRHDISDGRASDPLSQLQARVALDTSRRLVART